MTAAKTHAVVVLPDPMFVAQRRRIAELAASSGIPAMYHLRQFVEAGGLIFYGADYVEAFQQGAVLVDKILKGGKPADLPVEQPWRFALAINLKTGKALAEYEAAYFGVNATVRDYARFGMLLANDGALDGRQIIPAGWVRAATTPPAKQFQPGQASSFFG